MKKLLLAILVAVTFVNSICYSQDLKEKVLSKVTELKEETKVKALIAGLWKGDEELFTVALGESMTMVPATEDMHFRIGGVSETFLGTLLMVLVDKGMIDLNDKISNWMPDLLAADSVTIGMLMKNTGGYKDYVYNDEFVNLAISQPFREFTPEEIIEYSVEDGKLNFFPGTDSKYSHTEFTILEQVLIRALGRSMPELYSEYIFKPLGLNNTGYMTSPELPFPVLHSFSKDRDIYEDATYWNPSWTGGSGPLYSNILDLGKWGPIFGKGKLLSEESFKVLTGRYKNVGNPDIYFASGFLVTEGWYMQNPSFNGFSGSFGYNPDGEYTLIVYSTIAEDSKAGVKAFDIFKELIEIITPGTKLNF